MYQFLADDETIADFTENNADTNSFKIKQKQVKQATMAQKCQNNGAIKKSQ